MQTTKSSAWESGRIVRSRHPVKLTALLYLKEALEKEKYELCPGFIRIAKRFGAEAFEIEALLEDPRRRPG